MTLTMHLDPCARKIDPCARKMLMIRLITICLDPVSMNSYRIQFVVGDESAPRCFVSLVHSLFVNCHHGIHLTCQRSCIDTSTGHLHKTNMTKRLQEVNHRVYNKTTKWNDAIYFFVDDKDEQMIEEQFRILQEIKKAFFYNVLNQNTQVWERIKLSVRQV
jgi:hypothetical protein